MKNVSYAIALAFCISILAADSASADLVQNGDFSTSVSAPIPGPNFLSFADLDGGWLWKNATSWSGTTGAGVASDRVDRDGWAIAQANSVTTETGNEFELCFDWTPDGATEDMTFNVVGHKFGTSPAATERIVNGLNFFSNQSRTVGTGGTWTDLANGSVKTGNANAVQNIAVAGANTFTFNFGGDNIEDFDSIAIRFHAPLTTADTSGGSLDNVAIKDVSAVPEPSSLALFAMGLALVGVRRRNRN